MSQEDSLLTINEWLDRNGIDRAYKKDMRKTFEAIKGDLEAQDAKSYAQALKDVGEWLPSLIKRVEDAMWADDWGVKGVLYTDMLGDLVKPDIEALSRGEMPKKEENSLLGD